MLLLLDVEEMVLLGPPGADRCRWRRSGITTSGWSTSARSGVQDVGVEVCQFEHDL